MERGFKLQCNCTNCNYSVPAQAAGGDISVNKLTNEFCESVNKRYEYRINTSELYRTINLPQHIFHGYGYQRKDIHPVFKTTNANYGWLAPNAHTVPHRYFPRTQEFSSLLSKCGMYRNQSLNTSSDQ